MHDDVTTADRRGQIAVMFLSRRNGRDDAGYAAAAADMEALAAIQPGYRGIDSVRDADGAGITISWWADDASAIAWRDHPVHRTIRDRGGHDWYDTYEVAVAGVERSYRWER